MIPVLLPIVVAAIVASIVLTWLLPPATAEGEAPVPRFVDATAESGLDLVHWTGGANPETDPTTLGGGVVCIDYNRDGAVDLFFVNRGSWPWDEGHGEPGSGASRLLRNDGTGRFTDVTAAAGLDVEMLAISAAVGDFDNDGYPDLFVTCIGQDHLFRNRGDGTFENVTASAGMGGDSDTWSSGAAWIDIDGNGLLDLVVAHHARWPQELGLQMAFVIANVGRTYGTPTGFAPTFPGVYRNLGDSRFVPVAGGAGLRDIDPETGLPMPQTLAVIPVDANGDEHLDLLFTYHTRESSLFVNEGDGNFRKAAITLESRREGASADLAGASGMSFSGQIGRDLRLAALTTAALSGDEDKPARFASLAGKAGAVLLDYDFSGRLDIFDAGGRAEIDTHRFEHGRDFASRPRLLWNRGNGWTPVGPADETGWPPEPIVARGVVTADFDGDGDYDVVIAARGQPPVFLRNDQRHNLPWLQIALEGTHGTRDAFGARVEVHTPRRVHVQTLVPANGLFAQSTSTLFFGLAEDSRVRKVVVRWPSGTRQETTIDGINRRIVLVEP